MPPTKPEPEVEEPEEFFGKWDKLTLAWRVQNLKQAGLSDENAHLVAASDADLEVCRQLAAKGCPLDVLLKIAL